MIIIFQGNGCNLRLFKFSDRKKGDIVNDINLNLLNVQNISQYFYSSSLNYLIVLDEDKKNQKKTVHIIKDIEKNFKGCI